LLEVRVFFENWGSEGKDPGDPFWIVLLKRLAASEELGAKGG